MLHAHISEHGREIETKTELGKNHWIYSQDFQGRSIDFQS